MSKALGLMGILIIGLNTGKSENGWGLTCRSYKQGNGWVDQNFTKAISTMQNCKEYRKYNQSICYGRPRTWTKELQKQY